MAALAASISTNPFLGLLPPDIRGQLAESATTRSFDRGAVVGRELEMPTVFLLLLSGSITVSRDTEDGGHTVFRTLRPPAGIGFSSLAGEPYTADLVAAEECSVAQIPLVLLRSILDSHPGLLYKALSHLALIVDSLSTELIERRTLPVLDRVRSTIFRTADSAGELRVSHEELSDFVGASRANVTRALQELEAAGEIELGRRLIRIVRG